MALARSTSTSDPPIAVNITVAVEKDYQLRGVFLHLRRQNSARLASGRSGRHLLSLDEAKAIHADAQTQLQQKHTMRGMKLAYGSLSREIAKLILEEERKGLLEDPGYDAMSAVMPDSPARFHIGDTAIVWAERPDEIDLLVEVVEEHGLYPVGASNGAFIDKEGDRLDYKYGYIVRTPAGDLWFAPAYRLLGQDGKISHLRLVSSR